MDRPAEGQSRPRFHGQLAGRSVFLTPAIMIKTPTLTITPKFDAYSSTEPRHSPPGENSLAPPSFLAEETCDVGRTRFGNRARVVGLRRALSKDANPHASPTTKRSSPACPLLCSKAAAEEQSAS